MRDSARALVIMADDDVDDCLLIDLAFGMCHPDSDLRYVNNGEELMEWLRGQDDFADRERTPKPSLILLDLNMPKKDGFDALKEIKADPHLQAIPVIVFSTSEREQDILRSYRYGASWFVTKPESFDDLIEVVRSFSRYWASQEESFPKKEQRRAGGRGNRKEKDEATLSR